MQLNADFVNSTTIRNCIDNSIIQHAQGLLNDEYIVDGWISLF